MNCTSISLLLVTLLCGLNASAAPLVEAFVGTYRVGERSCGGSKFCKGLEEVVIGFDAVTEESYIRLKSVFADENNNTEKTIILEINDHTKTDCWVGGVEGENCKRFIYWNLDLPNNYHERISLKQHIWNNTDPEVYLTQEIWEPYDIDWKSAKYTLYRK